VAGFSCPSKAPLTKHLPCTTVSTPTAIPLESRPQAQAYRCFPMVISPTITARSSALEVKPQSQLADSRTHSRAADHAERR